MLVCDKTLLLKLIIRSNGSASGFELLSSIIFLPTNKNVKYILTEKNTLIYFLNKTIFTVHTLQFKT